MSRILLAFRAFFAVLFNAEAAQAVGLALDSGASPTASSPAPQPAPAAAAPKTPPKPLRNDALSLLAALQREGRLLDFLQESITGYSDAQIGAAVREVHRGCAAVIQRFFDPQPVVEQAEGATVALPTPLDATRFHVVGAATAPGGGVLRHHGWEARRCELPQWTGSAEASRLIAPAEVECR